MGKFYTTFFYLAYMSNKHMLKYRMLSFQTKKNHELTPNALNEHTYISFPFSVRTCP